MICGSLFLMDLNDNQIPPAPPILQTPEETTFTPTPLRKKLSRSQTISIVALVLPLLVLPVAIMLALNPVQLFKKAAETFPISPPVVITPTLVLKLTPVPDNCIANYKACGGTNRTQALCCSGSCDLKQRVCIPNLTPTPTPTHKLNPNRTMVIIDYADYSNLKNRLAQFSSDVQKTLGVKVDVFPIYQLSTKTPEYIQKILTDECHLDPINGCLNLEGAIFVGNAPYALYDQIYDNNNTAPFMFYYQDLDSTFSKNSNGHYYKYETFGTHEGPEIYISWIKPLNSPDLPPSTIQLQNYFDKHHAFFTKQGSPAPSAVAAFHCNIINSGAENLFIPLLNLYGRQNTVEISPINGCDDLNPLLPQLIQALSNKPEIAYLHSHGDEEHIWNLSGKDILKVKNLPGLLFSWGCRNGNFYQYSPNSIALSFINGNSLGLTYIAKLDSDDIKLDDPGCSNCRFVNSQTNFFDYWVHGLYAGKALLQMMRDFSNYTDKYGPPDPNAKPINLFRVSGPLQRVIIGSPFIYSPTTRHLNLNITNSVITQ